MSLEHLGWIGGRGANELMNELLSKYVAGEREREREREPNPPLGIASFLSCLVLSPLVLLSHQYTLP